jgi:hypothetical protein
MNEMKFTHVMGANEIPDYIQSCLKEQPAGSGMYNWIFAFKGEVNTYNSIKGKLDNYDILQVNMSPLDFQTIIDIRAELTRTENTKTKLVINNDYVCECWSDWDIDPRFYDSIQRMGDMVFGTEPHQVSNMINGTFCIPHPTNTKWIKRLGTDGHGESNSIGYIFHWWEGGTYLPYRTVEKVKDKYGIKKSNVYGYKPQHDKMRKFVQLTWDNVMPLDEFPNYAERLMKDKIVYDPNPFHTYGRNGVEAACWGVPIVGSNRVFSYNKLFPEFACDPYDFKATMEKFDFIMNNPEEVKKIMARAYKEVEWFNYENSKKRFLDAFDIAIKRGGYKWYQMNG